MPLPYYVSPEQMMQDKAEYAKKGIAKGRSIIAMEYRAKRHGDGRRHDHGEREE